MWLWNFNDVHGQYELMTLASNYAQSSTVPMAWDPAERAYIGYQPARTADNRAATERLASSLAEASATSGDHERATEKVGRTRL